MIQTMTMQTWFDRQANKRHGWNTLVRAWIDLYPEWENRSGVNSALLAHLKTLNALGVVSFPKTRASWSTGNPSCPEWCSYNTPKDVLDVEAYKGPWHARLGFNTQYKGETLALLVQINSFLMRQDHFDYDVPLKERSLQICGDEKRLDGFRLGSNTHLFKGLLSLNDIGAFHAEAPLAYEVYPDSTTQLGLILENQDSYYSFRVWNKKMQHYRAVIYGSGNAFSSSYRNLGALQADHAVEQFEYLGDVDYSGFQIPDRVSSMLDKDVLVPANAWYQWLLKSGVRRTSKDATPERALSAWIQDPELRAQILDLWSQGQWIPQESLGLDALLSMG